MDIVKLYERFVKERRYLKNVSPHTLDWYKYSFNAFASHVVVVDGTAIAEMRVKEWRDGSRRVQAPTAPKRNGSKVFANLIMVSPYLGEGKAWRSAGVGNANGARGPIGIGSTAGTT